jgi:hypothetical protein
VQRRDRCSRRGDRSCDWPLATEEAKPDVPEPAPAPLETRAAAVPDRPARPAARPATAWLIGLSGNLDSSVTPQIAMGGAIRGGMQWKYLRAELEAALFAPTDTRDDAGRGGTFQLAYAAPLFCITRSLRGPRALLCGGYELGLLSAEGEGVERPYQRTIFWHAARLELGLSLPLSMELAVSTRLGGALALSRRPFVLDEPQAVHRPALASLRAAVGLELTL